MTRIGRLSDDNRSITKIICHYSADCCQMIGLQSAKFEWHILKIEVGGVSADRSIIDRRSVVSKPFAKSERQSAGQKNE